MGLPWNNRAEQFSVLKFTVFAGALVPALWIVIQASNDMLGTKPVTEAIHQSGDWAVRLLLLSLCVTPLRHLAQWPGLIAVRRMLGLAALGYVLMHFSLYVVQQSYDALKIISEIALRIYLTIGFVALAGLVALGTTSTDGMIRRLGSQKWNALHKSVYALAILSLIHFFLQSKIDVTQPVLMTGFFLWLIGFRLLRSFSIPVGFVSLTALGALAGLATALVEATWYASMTGAAASRVLAANLDFDATIRPAWWVFVGGLALVLVYLSRRQTPTVKAQMLERKTASAAKAFSS